MGWWTGARWGGGRVPGGVVDGCPVGWWMAARWGGGLVPGVTGGLVPHIIRFIPVQVGGYGIISVTCTKIYVTCKLSRDSVQVGLGW